jgi:C-terminal processing protease CtpA/Prc
MRRFTAFAIVGMFIAAAPAFAQQAGTRTAEENPTTRTEVDAPLRGCGFLGIYPTNIGPRSAAKLGLTDRRGALVEGVVKETGAARAGIVEKDVITAFNGEAITHEGQLRRLIISQTPGTIVRLDLLRNGQPMTINAEITSRSKYYGGPDCNATPEERQRFEERRRDAVRDLDISVLEPRGLDNEMRAAERELDAARQQLRKSVVEVRTQRNLASGYDATTGMGLQRMSEQLARYFNTGSGSGALVAEVAEKSPAQAAGMQAGDVIVAVNGASITGPMDAVKAIVEDKDGVVELTIVRDQERRTIQIRTATERAPIQVAPQQSPSESPDLGGRVAPELMRLVGSQDLQ